MRYSRLLAAMVVLALAVGVANEAGAQAKAAKRQRKAQAVRRKARRQPHPAFAKIKEDPNLPRVLLIGDSISVGYTIPVRKLLEGKANVIRIPTNGGPTSRGLEQIDKWLDIGKLDVIHFNFGLHDCRIEWPKDELQIKIKDYEANLRKIVARLKKTDAKLIWATTTAVVDGEKRKRRQSDVQAYNAVAAKIMKEEGIQVDDLYAALMEIDEAKAAAAKAKKDKDAEKITRQAITTADGTHFTPKGYEYLARRVADAVLEALGEKEK